MGEGSARDPWRNSNFAKPPVPSARSAQGGSDRQPAKEADAGRRHPGTESGWSSGGAGWGTAAASSAQRSWSSAAGGPRTGGEEFVRAPLAYLGVSYCAAVAALAIALIPAGLGAWIMGWVLAAFLGLGAALMFTIRDAIRQGETFYLHVPSARWLYQGAIAISLVAIVATALRIALVIGRLG